MSIEKPESKIENIEESKKYIYRDYSAGDKVGKVVFECVAKGILDADKLYEEKTGNNPEKQNSVGCAIEKIEPSAEKQ